MNTNILKSLFIPFQSLALDAQNVRKKAHAPAGIAEMATSIAHVGLINPLTVTKDEAGFTVIAGGRRLAALKLLEQEGKLPAIFPDGIPCQVISDDASKIEISLTENIFRSDMTAADQIEAWGALAKDGVGIDTIASRFGVSQTLVKQRIALANVIPEILQLLRDEKISLDAVKAFTLTDDPERQRAVLKDCGSNLQAWHVRRHLTEDTISSKDKRVVLIGLENYIAAGGTLTRDLFDEDVTILHDKGILNKLYRQKMEAHRREWLDKGWSWVNIEGDEDARSIYRCTVASGNELEPTDEEATRLSEIDDAFNLMEEEGNQEGVDYDALYEERDGIEAEVMKRQTWPDEIMAISGVDIAVHYDGTLDITRGLIDPKTQTSSEAPEVKSTALYNGAHETDLGTGRTRIVQTAILQEPELVNDLLAFNLALETRIGNSEIRYSRFGSIKIGQWCFEDDAAIHSQTKPLNQYYDRLDKSWAEAGDIHTAFAAFRKLPAEQKQAWQNWAVAGSINVGIDKSVASMGGQKFEALIPELDIDWPNAWRPDAGYFGRLSKRVILDMMRPVLGDEWVSAHEGDKKAALVTAVSTIMAGEALSLNASQQMAAAKWTAPGFEPVINQPEMEDVIETETVEDKPAEAEPQSEPQSTSAISDNEKVLTGLRDQVAATGADMTKWIFVNGDAKPKDAVLKPKAAEDKPAEAEAVEASAESVPAIPPFLKQG